MYMLKTIYVNVECNLQVYVEYNLFVEYNLRMEYNQ